MFKKVGIICASDTELEPFMAHLKNAKITEAAMLKFYEAAIAGVEVVAVYSGVCKVNAAIAAQLLISLFQVDVMINAGTAGGMDESVQLFDTIISEQTTYHDVADDILTDFHPWMPSVFFPADPGLLAAAREYSLALAFPVRFGTMVTGEQFIEDNNRNEISLKYRPLSVDMETAGIAHACYANCVAFIAIRTITDTAAHIGIENFEKNCEKASGISAEITLGFIAHLKKRSS